MAKWKAGVGTGGSIERNLVRRYVKRRLKAKGNFNSAAEELELLLDWLGGQPQRTVREGGLGRR